MKFVHLHNHSHYSILDAITTPRELVKAAKDDGMEAIALTDHGVMFGLMDFQKQAKEYGIKPIFGMEAYIAEASRFDKIQTKKSQGMRNYYHLLLIAKDITGYRNLVKLTSLAFSEGFYYRPRIDKQLLEKYKDGLIATSACLGGVVSAHIIDGNLNRALSEASYYRDLFGDDFYLELQNHHYSEDEIALREIPKIAKKLGIKMIATNDIHYLKKEHAIAHNVHLLIKDTNAANADKVDIKALRYKTDEFYFRSTEEMIELFKDYPEAISNTNEIADKCDLKIKFPVSMPKFTLPENNKSKNLEEYLEEVVWEGIRRRYKQIDETITQRVNYELSIINKMGFANYFLVVADLIKAARERGIMVGPGRGSAAGSIVAYALEITNVEPLEGNLLFERFLNPERISLPDIDIDFDDEKRDQVIKYCQEKYGTQSIAQIITFGKMSSRMVLKDVGRVLNIPLSEINKITAKIPVKFGKVTPLKDALDLVDLKYVKESKDPKIQELINYSMILEDKNRSVGTHAAGIVITPSDVTDFVPIFQNPKGGETAVDIATQYSMNYLEDAGVIKMDFLGLRTLSIIERTLMMIKNNYGIDIDIENIPRDDKKTYDLISEGKTLAVFQFESNGMQEYLRQLKPHSLEELSAMNALYRPGPMSQIPLFIARKHGEQPIEYLHPIMESVLSNTYGILVYQEQVMQLVQKVANFTLGEADMLRRAMGKKQRAEVDKMRPKFMEGAQANGVSKEVAEQIFELIDKFADYGFNKSHSWAYSWLAYQTAYLKANYPAEFLAANMTAELNNQDKIVELIDEAKSLGIEIMPPDINKSEATFTVKDGVIYFGLAAVKGVGIKSVENIVETRKAQPFKSFYDFIKRTDPKQVNRRVLEALIFAGAFDSITNGKRRALYEAIDEALEFSKSQSKNEGMKSIFEFDDTPNNQTQIEPELPNVAEWTERERLEHEKEVLNFYISGHPLKEFDTIVKSFSNLTLTRIKLGGDEEDTPELPDQVRFCGLISNIRTRRDKSNRLIAFVMVEDYYGKIECIFWSETYAKYQHLLIENSTVTITGKLDASDPSALKIVVSEVYTFPETIEKFATGLIIYLDKTSINRNGLEKLKKQLEIRPGGRLKLIFVVNGDNIKSDKYISFNNYINFQNLEKLKSLGFVRNYKFTTE